MVVKTPLTSTKFAAFVFFGCFSATTALAGGNDESISNDDSISLETSDSQLPDSLPDIGLTEEALERELSETLGDSQLPQLSPIPPIPPTPTPTPEIIELDVVNQFEMTAATAYDKEARDAILSPFEITYKAKYSGKGIPITVKAKRNLSRDENKGWTFRFTAKSMLAKINEFTDFTMDQAQLMPQRYVYKRSGLVKDKHDRLTFNWNDNQAFNQSLKSEWSVDLQPNTFDKLSYQLQLRLDLSQGKKSFQYYVADRGRIKPYTFEIIREETLDTKIGEQETIVVERIENKEKRRVTIWFAKNLNYTLLKLEQKEKDGEHYLVTIEKMK